MNYDINLEFDKQLKSAFAEDLKYELQSLPDEEELSKIHKFSKEFFKKMQYLIKIKNKKLNATVCVKRTAIIIFVIICIGASILVISPQARAEVHSIIMKWLSDFVEFNSTNSGKEYNFKDFSFAINYIPKGYERVDTLESNSIKIMDYENKNNDLKFTISIYLNNGTHTTLVDNEKRTVEKIKINLIEGYLFRAKDEGEYNILLFYSEEFRINLIGTISCEELIKIAENIKIK